MARQGRCAGARRYGRAQSQASWKSRFPADLPADRGLGFDFLIAEGASAEVPFLVGQQTEVNEQETEQYDAPTRKCLPTRTSRSMVRWLQATSTALP